MDVGKSIKAIVGVVFLLLAVLFGAQIMAFIFGNLGPTQAGLAITDPGYNQSLQIQNNSLNALDTYSAGASDQMSIVLIVITLVLLLAVFALFWQMFIKDKVGKSSGGGGNFGG